MLANITDNTKTTIIRKACPFCGKVASKKSETIFNGKKKITLECGHTIIDRIETIDNSWTASSLSGKIPFPYQYKTLDFIIESNFRAGIFHEQGVGKTACALLSIKRFGNKFLPFAYICKAGLRHQAFKEILDWTDVPAQIISNGSEKAFPEIFKAFIISYDTLKNNPEVLKNLNLKLVILDECQQIKNAEAKRTKAIRNAIRDIPYVLALSGTPIKNHAGEYFPILNILKPEIFHSQAQFERDYCDTYSNGWGYKVGGLNRRAAEEFKKKTKDFIIRFERSEVLPDLPKIFRKNFFVELGEEVETAYKKAYLEFAKEYVTGHEENILAKLNRLRQITGIAKIKPTTDFVEEFLEDSERKICLFVHHQAVGLGLVNHIGNVCKKMGINGPLQLTAENAGSDAGYKIDELWRNDKNYRVMIASTLSAGEGKNWQHCSDAMIIERQWNPANEEQAEARFPRPGISKEIESISITYAIALGTPDEYLSEIVERKREICKKTMGNESVEWNQTSIIKELSEALFVKGGKRWML